MTKPTNKQLKRVFDRVAGNYDDFINPYTLARRREILVSWAKGKCLEVGAGTGEISRALSEKDLDVVAIDISPKMVEEIRKKGIKAVVADAEKLPFKDRTFDTVVAAELVYCLDSPKKFIKEARRVLKPKGRLLITSANEDLKVYDRLRSFLRKLGFSKMYFDDSVHNFVTSSELRKLLTKQGFKILEERKVIVFPFGFLDWLNKVLEETPFSQLGIFITIAAQKS